MFVQFDFSAHGSCIGSSYCSLPYIPLFLVLLCYWLTAASAVWLCELHVGNTKGSRWLTSLRRRRESLAGSLSPQRHRVNVFVCGQNFVEVAISFFPFLPFVRLHEDISSLSWDVSVHRCALLVVRFWVYFGIFMPFLFYIIVFGLNSLHHNQINVICHIKLIVILQWDHITLLSQHLKPSCWRNQEKHFNWSKWRWMT